MKNNINAIVKILVKEYPENKIALHSGNPVQMLVATILSAQCTDIRVNIVTKELFRKYKTAADFANADMNELEDEIRSTGFYKNKTKNIVLCCKEIAGKYKGTVPRSIEELVKLPGIGRKTANVVLGNSFGIPGIVVDTHVKRIGYRLGLTKNTDPVKIEFDLMKIIPKPLWVHCSNSVILHGRKVCSARSPKCDICKLEKYCPKKGV